MVEMNAYKLLISELSDQLSCWNICLIFLLSDILQLLGILVRIILENDVDITVNHEFIFNLDDITKVRIALCPVNPGYPGIDTDLSRNAFAGTNSLFGVYCTIFFLNLVTRLISPVRPIMSSHTPVPDVLLTPAPSGTTMPMPSLVRSVKP